MALRVRRGQRTEDKIILDVCRQMMRPCHIAAEVALSVDAVLCGKCSTLRRSTPQHRGGGSNLNLVHTFGLIHLQLWNHRWRTVTTRKPYFGPLKMVVSFWIKPNCCLSLVGSYFSYFWTTFSNHTRRTSEQPGEGIEFLGKT